MSRLLYHAGRLRSNFCQHGAALDPLSTSLSLLTRLSTQQQQRQQQQQQQQRLFFQGSLLWNEGRLPSHASPPGLDEDSNERISLRSMDTPCYQQVRWKGRNDGARFHMKPRPPSKKELKEYARHKREMESSKHNAPGSKAGPLRAITRYAKEQLFKPLPDLPSPREREQYDVGEALVDAWSESTDYSPTPVPHNIAHKEREFYNQVADQMENFRRNVDQMGKQPTDVTGEALASSSVELPGDRDISLALRAFRDRNGTRLKPVGLAKALKILLQDLGLPLAAFGTLTYSALLSCCRTPTEARRVMDLMKQHDVEIGTYAWAILVDIHAKVGDYQGCVAVHDEMAEAGLAPVLASYTSLLSACYRICSDGRNSKSDRVKASEVAWEKWTEMFSIGVAPDVMAYGAILRIFASRGMPERCLNILDEMAVFNVKPSTLCFTTALRAVATSHEIAIRYERGDSPRMMKREEITHHHGKLAQEILIRAENVGIEQDQGFIAALISCAGAAGDLATAKAIYTASQIRNLKQFRTAGIDDRTEELAEESDINLALMSGEEAYALASSSNGLHKRRHRKPKKSDVQQFEEREYGKDSRVITALARACANAASVTKVGTMWQGRENDGYLCINSLRLLKTPGEPEYQDVSVPGEQRSDFWDEEQDRIDYQNDVNWGRKHGRRHRGVIPSGDIPLTIDDLSQDMAALALNPDGSKKKEYAQTTFDDAWKMKYGEFDRFYREVRGDQGFILPDLPDTHALPSSDGNGVKSIAFSYDTMRWETVAPAMASIPASHASASSSYGTSYGSGSTGFTSAAPEKEVSSYGGGSSGFSSAPEKNVVEQKHTTVEKGEEKLFFNYETMKWETRGASLPNESPDGSNATADVTSVQEKKDTQPGDGSLFADSKIPPDDESVNTSDLPGLGQEEDSGPKITEEERYEMDFELFYSELKKEIVDSGAEMGTVKEGEARELYASLKAQHVKPQASVKTVEFSPFHVLQDKTIGQGEAESTELTEAELDAETINNMTGQELAEKFLGRSALDPDDDPLPPESKLEELREYLPMFSDRRLKRILKVFSHELGNPAMIDLVLAVRERMPDYIDRNWLKSMSRITATYVLDEAEQKELVDTKFLNAMLQMKTSVGFLNDAIAFRQTQFKKRKIEPTQLSDRLILQMFLREDRFKRAMEFKAKLAAESRPIDIKSYGSFVEFCGRRGQIGTALMLLEECIRVHKGIPEEAALGRLRFRISEAGLDDHPKVLELIGRDPLYHIKKGIVRQYRSAKLGKKRRHVVQKIHDAMRFG